MAYPNKVINEGSFGSYQASEAISLYQRVKWTATVATDGSGKPKLAVAGATDRACGVAMQPIASGSWGTIKFINSPGEQFANVSGSVTIAALIYAAASGAVTASSGGGAYVVGIATSVGANGGTLTYQPVTAIA